MSMYQQAQQMSQSGGQQQNDQYNIRQKDAQIIRVESTDNSISMNLAGIVPNFTNLQNVLTKGEIFYQLRSFRCRNAFNNIKKTDSVVISVKAQMINTSYLLGTSGNRVYYTYDTKTSGLNQVIPLVDPKTQDGTDEYILNAQQIVNQFDTQLVKFNYDQLNGFQQALYKSSGARMIYMSMIDQFRVSFDNGYLQLKPTAARTNPAQVLYATYGDNHPTNVNQNTAVIGSNGYSFVGLEFTIATNPASSISDRSRIAKIFGMNDMTEDYNYSVSLSVSEDNLIAAMTTSFHDPASFPVRQGQGEPISSISTGSPMNIYFYDRLYIRSNLQSNIWNREGKKSNVIAIIPMQGGQDTNAIEYNPSGSEMRTYNIKDSLNSIQHLQLEITDEHGDFVQFTERYQLEFAMFFIPTNMVQISQ